MTLAAFETVDDILSTLARGEGQRDEPDVDHLSHALQTAALLAGEHPDDLELHAAGLVHDIAGILDQEAVHDRVGAALVEPLLGPRVAALVGGHVAAKRYLVATDPSYAGLLSARSIETLGYQGGPADAAVIAGIESSPDRDAILTLRRADDRAKAPGLRPLGLDHWRPILEALARK